MRISIDFALTLIVLVMVFGVLGALLIFGVTKSRSVGTFVGLILVILLVPVFVVTLLIPTSTRTRYDPSPNRFGVREAIAPVESQATWSPPLQTTYGWPSDLHGAGIYSSAENAGVALARSLLQDFNGRFAEYPAAVYIRVPPLLDNWVPTLGPQLAKHFREVLPSSEINYGPLDADATTGDDALLVTLDSVDLTRSSSAPWDSSIMYVNGGLKFKAEYPDYTFEDSKPFVEKPWVDRFDEYLSQQPGRRLFRAVSSEFGLSQQESEQSARNVAAQILAAQVDPGIHHLDRAKIAQVITNNLDSSGLIIDRFTQERQTGSGNKVWQTALLIDAETDKLDAVVKPYLYRAFVQRESGIVGIVLLAVLVVIVYLVLNELTKGYLVWNLRVAAMLLMLFLAMAFCWWVKIT